MISWEGDPSDRWPGIEPTLRPPRGWFGALGYLVLGGTDIHPPSLIDKTVSAVRKGMGGQRARLTA